MDWLSLLLLISGIYLLVLVPAGRYAPPPADKPDLWLAAAALSLMLLIRVYVAGAVPGYPGDVQLFQMWAVRAAGDLPGFYSGGVFADYPPGYMYVLFLVGKLKAIFSMGDNSREFLTLIKMPAIIADMATVVLVYRLAEKQGGSRYALVPALMYGLNPAIIVNSAAWGQVDAVLTFFVALSVLLLADGRLAGAVVAFVTALLIKPQALIFTPLLICAFLGRLASRPNGREVMRLAACALAGIAVFVAGILPFAIKHGPWWIFGHYRATVTNYPYASINAFNLFALSGANFTSQNESWLLFSYRNWSTFFIVATTLFAMAVYFYADLKGRLPYIGLFLIAAVFTLASRMHERYLFPALLFALLAYLFTRDSRLLVIYAGYSVTHFLNVAGVLAGTLAAGMTVVPRFDPLLVTVSFANVVLLALTVAYGLRIMRVQPGSPAADGT